MVVMKEGMFFWDFEQESYNDKRGSEGGFPVKVPQEICQRI
jgi:hypothetical protein